VTLSLLALVGVLRALTACGSFGEEPSSGGDAGDGGAADGAVVPDGATAPDAAPDAGRKDAAAGDAASVHCGSTRCPVGPDSVCCVSDAGSKCTTVSGCAGVPVACDDTEDCVALGFKGLVCCGFNDGVGPKLKKTSCVQSSACDANGPQDQMCNLQGPADQCQVAKDGRTKCTSFAYSNATGYAFCRAP